MRGFHPISVQRLAVDPIRERLAVSDLLERRAERTLIVIGQVLGSPYLDITAHGQFETWIPEAENLGFRIRHSHGIPPKGVWSSLDRLHEWHRWHGVGRRLIPRLDNTVGRPFRRYIPRANTGPFLSPTSVAWQQRLLDLYACQRWKVIGTMRKALEEEFDYLYLTTASSYVNPRALAKLLRELQLTGVYAGTKMVDAGSGQVFASGANRILSRDVVERVVNRRVNYENDVMEDVGLGRLVGRLGISLIPLGSLNVSSLRQVDRLTQRDLTEIHHFRVKSQVGAHRMDVPLMHRLHERRKNLVNAGRYESTFLD